MRFDIIYIIFRYIECIFIYCIINRYSYKNWYNLCYDIYGIIIKGLKERKYIM